LSIETERLPVARPYDQVFVGYRIVVRRPARRIVPHPPPHLGRRRVEDVEDVGRLSVADLDAERVDEDEAIEPAAIRRDLRGQPATERQADDRHLLVG
jgi:hypothetical protein